MNYIGNAILAMLTISICPGLGKIVMSEMSPRNTLTVSTSVMLLYLLVMSAIEGDNPFKSIALTKGWLVVIALGILFAIAMSKYYEALNLGPINIVTPIWCLQIPVACLIGYIFFKEGMSLSIGLGIFFALLSIYFVTRPS